MAPGRITVEAQWWLPPEIDLIIEGRDIGTAARITSGGRDTGAGGTANTSGSAGITSYADTKKAALRNAVVTGSPQDECVQCADMWRSKQLASPKPAIHLTGSCSIV